MLNYFVLLIGIVVFLTVSYFSFSRDLLSPSIITFTVFLISTLCVGINSSLWQVSFHTNTVLILLISFAVILFVELFFKKTSPSLSFRKEKEKAIVISRTGILLTYIVLTFCFFAFSVYIMKLGASIGANGLIAIGQVKDSSIVSVGGLPLIAFDVCFYSGFVFIYVFCWNVFMSKEGISHSLIYLYPVFLGILSVIFRGARGPLFQYLVCFCFLALLFSKKNIYSKKRTRLRTFCKVFVCGFLFVLAFYYLREIVKGKENSTSLIDYVTYYLGSPLYLFDKFIQDPSQAYSGFRYLGVATFTNFYGTLYHLGLINNPVYGMNFLACEVSSIKVMAGNEFTFFMRPYFDFGFFGSLVFTALFYGFFDYFYYRKIRSSCIPKKKHKMVLFYSMFFYSVVMSFYYCFTAQDVRPQTVILVFGTFVLFEGLSNNGRFFGKRLAGNSKLRTWREK